MAPGVCYYEQVLRSAEAEAHKAARGLWTACRAYPLPEATKEPYPYPERKIT